MVSVLFVCLANICRSPALEASLRHLAIKRGVSDQLKIDSCGLGWFHIGERPDPRIFEEAKKRGILIDHKAQQIQERFFDEFDYILAVDEDVAEQLKLKAASDQQRKKIRLATDFSKKFHKQPIPDPYYLSQNGFVDVMEIVLDCCQGFLNHVKL